MIAAHADAKRKLEVVTVRGNGEGDRRHATARRDEIAVLTPASWQRKAATGEQPRDRSSDQLCWPNCRASARAAPAGPHCGCCSNRRRACCLWPPPWPRPPASVQTCSLCGNLDSHDPCAICTDPDRDQPLICVVEGVGDLWALERAAVHRGLYHVLGGTLSALGGDRAGRSEFAAPAGPGDGGRGDGNHPGPGCHGRGRQHRALADRPACTLWRAGDPGRPRRAHRRRVGRARRRHIGGGAEGKAARLKNHAPTANDR